MLLLALSKGVDNLEDKGREGESIADEANWGTFVNGLPPLAFEIAKMAKELRTWVEGMAGQD